MNDVFHIHGIVSRILATPKTSQKGDYLYRSLELMSSEDDGRVFLIFPENAGADAYEFPLLCWEGAAISVHSAVLNNKLDSGVAIYAVTSRSDLLLEPTRPIGSIEAADAAICIRSADVRNRVGVDEPFWIAKGKLIHSIFEYLIQHYHVGDDKLFEKAFRAGIPGFVAILPGSDFKTEYDEIVQEAKVHFTNIKAWIEDHVLSFDAVETEVDRVSLRWGLKGRADAVFKKGPHRFVLELKSGRFTAREHLLQLYAYLLMFSDEDTSSKGKVFYTSLGTVEELTLEAPQLKRLLQAGRNKAVAVRHSYIVDNATLPFDRCLKMGKCFSRAGCEVLFPGAKSGEDKILTAKAREYYDHWFKLLSVDAWDLDGDWTRIYDPATLEDRIKEGVTIPVTDIAPVADKHTDPAHDKSSSASGLRVELPVHNVHVTLDAEAVDLNPGDQALLHRGPAVSWDAVRAKVLECSENRVVLASKALPDLFASARDEDWFIEKTSFSRGRDNSRQGLFRFLMQGDPHVVNLVTGEGVIENNPSPRPAPFDVDEEPPDLLFSEGLDCELNEHQEQAVLTALDCEGAHLLHGPPGTGKTRVLARLVRLCLDRGERILIACPTNIALDRLLLSLLKLGVNDFIRVGGVATISTEFKRAVAALGDKPVFLDQLTSRATNFQEFIEHFNSCPLIGATAYQTAAHFIFRKQKFDRVIVDEAGQLDEPSTLGPLTMAPKFTLGGDHQQLPPVVRTKAEPDADPGLERSLFERLFHTLPESQISRLQIQYRMSSGIQDIPSKLFYDGMLQPDPNVALRRLSISPEVIRFSAWKEVLDPRIPVVFVDIEGADKGKARPEEAKAASEIVREFLLMGVQAADMGIITPYRAQQALIRGLLKKLPVPVHGLSVDTVDRFQGGEREIIILSLTRSDSVTSFLADRKRLNVSLSRARSKLILLGHGPVLRENSLFSSILELVTCVKPGAST